MAIVVSLLVTTCSRAQSDFETENKLATEVRSSLNAFRIKWVNELSKLPRPKKTPKGSYIGEEAPALAGGARIAFEKSNLAEAEEKLTASLSLNEDQHNRQIYALVLIEEKKYLEALPSCVDISLEEHEVSYRFFVPNSVEYSSLSHLMLAHVLAQVGDLHTATIEYNYVRSRIDSELKREIARIPEEQRQKTLAVDLRYSPPLPPLEIDPDKADRKFLIEATRILFIKAKGSGEDGTGTFRLVCKMIDAAYEDNPGSAITNYFKGWITLASGETGLKRRVADAKNCQVFYQKAVDVAGTKSELGKLASRSLQQAMEQEIGNQKRYEDALKNGYDGD